MTDSKPDEDSTSARQHRAARVSERPWEWDRYFVLCSGDETPLGAWRSAPAEQLVSSARVTVGAAHDIVAVWVRGGLAGELTVPGGDGERIAALLGLTEVTARSSAAYKPRDDDDEKAVPK